MSEEPRESNTEGGVFPAIFGTVMMVFIMSILVTPLGVLAAFYLREYAKQGPFVSAVRIAVNNLAGVPSIVFGVFGVGFFIYFVGGTIDRVFYSELLPTPTYGTGGILWASLTLALLTVPVVIVATEEGLAAIPRGTREASLALSATKLETTLRVVLPAVMPSILTGLILAMARAAGEVVPLMITGVVKLAPSLPLDGTLAVPPPRPEVHAPGLRHLRRRFPVAERRRGAPDGVRDDAALALHRGVPEPVRDQHTQPAPSQIRDISRLESREETFMVGHIEVGRALRSAPPTAPILEVPMAEIERLSLWYGTKIALKDVSMSMPKHRVTAYIGPSGCGKSTLLRCLNRMNDLIDGVEDRREHPHRRHGHP